MHEEDEINPHTKRILNVLDGMGLAVTTKEGEERIDHIVDDALTDQHHAIAGSMGPKTDEIRVQIQDLQRNAFDTIAKIARKDLDLESGLALLEELLDARLHSISEGVLQLSRDINGRD